MRINEIVNVLEETDRAFNPLLAGLNNIVRTENLNQLKLKSELAESLNTKLEAVKANLNTYHSSSSGLWNKLRFLFKENPNKKVLTDSIQTLTNTSSEFGYSELINIPLSFGEVKLSYHPISDKLQSISSNITEIMAAPPEQGINYELLSLENKKGLHMAFSVSQTLKNILDVPLLDDDGNLTSDSERIVNQDVQKELLTA